MKALLNIENSRVEVDFSKGIDISIPLYFNGDQPNTYNVDKATSKPYQDGTFFGDTRKGGPCNFETYRLTPHCNGTHTECIGHITKQRIPITDCLKQEIIPSSLITIEPKNSNEKYNPDLDIDDLVITKEILENKLKNINCNFLHALIIRTLPNNEEKKRRDYMKIKPSFFTIDAMKYIVDLGVQHLLVDMPSVDRLFDEGILSAHNIFWETKDKKFNIKSSKKTITEMIFVSDKIKDGKYLLNLQFAPFMADASPSRPILYKINEL